MPSGELTARQTSPDTIAAVATPPGRGGVGIVRVSGPLAADIARRLLGRIPGERRAVHAVFRNRGGGRIDEGIALFFAAPRSYTGEDVLELQGHGGPVVMHEVLSAVLDAGARPAEPGEFTRRAYLSGKLDLAQAEAVADLIDAASREAARSAMRSLSGEFSSAIDALAGRLTELRALTEAMLDFPEEDVDAMHRDDAMARLEQIRADLGEVLRKSRQGSLLRSGIHVVLAGRPNVGKSSLLNRLAGEERAIVASVPGTTRDAVREPIQVRGVPIILVDTAGLRETSDEVELLGMARTRQEVARADVVIVVTEAGQAETPEAPIPEGAARIDVINKIDLAAGLAPGREGSRIFVSARSGAGIEALRDALIEAAGGSVAGEGVFLARERHLRALRAAAERVEAAARSGGWEFFAEELRLAQESLGEITGRVSADDLLGEIFAKFCIGK